MHWPLEIVRFPQAVTEVLFGNILLFCVAAQATQGKFIELISCIHIKIVVNFQTIRGKAIEFQIPSDFSMKNNYVFDKNTNDEL